MAFDLNKRHGDDSAPTPPAPAVGDAGGAGSRFLPAAVALAILVAVGWYFFGRDAGTPSGAPVDRPSGKSSADSGVPGQSSAPPVEESSRLVAQGAGSTAQATPAQSADGASQANPKASVDPPKSGGAGGAITSTGDVLSAAVPGRQDKPAEPGPLIAALFPAGSSAVPSTDDALVARILARTAEGAVVQINGYASSEGDLQLNTVLSERRAAAFKAYLVAKGASAERLLASGRGVVDPLASNDTEAGRAKNRRVEVVF